MNFEPAANDISRLMAELLQLIVGMNVSPAAKKDLLIKSFGMVGAEFYEKIFNDCSTVFDSTAIKTLGMQDLDDQTGRLAQKLIRNDALGRVTNQIVDGYFNSLLANAQNEAFKNAVSLDKVPTLTRSLRGETCGWCQAKVGTWTNPSGELFARHDNCDCKIVVSGYKSRNGELKNYTKNSKSSNTIRDKNVELKDIFSDIRPGKGSISREGGGSLPKRRAHEKQVAEVLKKSVGGDFIIKNEAGREQASMLDIVRDNYEVIEVKRITSKSSLDSRLRDAINQFETSPMSTSYMGRRILVLDNLSTSDILNKNNIKDIIDRRIYRAIQDGHTMLIEYILVLKDKKIWLNIKI